MSSTILNLTSRGTLDGTESLVLATAGANWKSLQTALPISINTTPILSGTSTRLLYDNAGTIGEALVTYSTADNSIKVGPTTGNQIQLLPAAAGSNPSVIPTGNDANVSLLLQGEGTGAVGLYSRGFPAIFAQNDPGTLVNWMRFAGSATGGSVAMTADGSDTNISVLFGGKGSGAVGLYSQGFAACFAQNSAGTLVNWLQFSGSITGVSPQVAASGSDTNISLLLVGQGTGSVIINAGAVATTAADGFLYIPTCAGTPTGAPTTFSGRIAMVYDTTNHQFWFYDSGWKQPKTPAGAAIVTWQ